MKDVAPYPPLWQHPTRCQCFVSAPIGVVSSREIVREKRLVGSYYIKRRYCGICGALLWSQAKIVWFTKEEMKDAGFDPNSKRRAGRRSRKKRSGVERKAT